MSVIGIDFGNENCFIAVARAGGIETIANDYSQRATPSYVAFGPKNRELGVSAKHQQIMNLKNTIFGFKRLIGRKYKDQFIQNEMTYLPYPLCELSNGHLGVKVSYLKENMTFSFVQVAAMLFTKLKETAEIALKIKVTDCVLSVPAYFTDAARRAMLDAGRIAGLNILRLMNETTAVGLSYGFYKEDFAEDKPKIVVFIDMGHSAIQISACAFTKGKLKILASIWDTTVGGRDFDNIMVRHFADEFRSKYKLDVLSNERAIVRLLQECEKLKKQLSANPRVLPLNIECFMEDKDVSGSLGREEFEKLSDELLCKVEDAMRNILIEANLRLEDISSVEIVGGSTRIPAIRRIVQKVFRCDPSTTLNLDEAVARGCALQCAMLSPTFKVKEFCLSDVQPYPIKLVWHISRGEQGEVEVFHRNHQVPFSKFLTFFRTEQFTLEAHNGETREKPHPDNLIGSFIIRNVSRSQSGESAKIRVKVRINVHGIFSVCSAVVVDKHSESDDNELPDQKAEDIMDVGSQNHNETLSSDTHQSQESDREKLSQKKHKKAAKEVELPIESKVPQLSSIEMKKYIDNEVKMVLQDKLENERIYAKNALEEYVYEMRGLLGDQLVKFIDKQECENFMHRLETIENWLYEDGEDQNQKVYVEKISELKAMGEPVLLRKREYEQRPGVLDALGRVIQKARKVLEAYLSADEQFSHIDPKEMEQVQKIVDEKQSWLNMQLSNLLLTQPHHNPPVLIEHILTQKEMLENVVNPILNKPRPQVEQPMDDQKTTQGDN